MKLRLSILLLAAAALAAAPAAGQTVKSLGYNTTNGQIVYSGTNALTFTNALQFSTNARAATRTNLGGTTVGDSVFTATNAAAAATAIGLGTTNSVAFSSIAIGAGDLIFSNDSIYWATDVRWSPEDNTFFTAIQFDSTNIAAATLTNLGLGATNAVTFSNITATGTLAVSNTATFSTNVTVSGNATLNGSGNLAPSQTADSASSLMTRDLVGQEFANPRNRMQTTYWFGLEGLGEWSLIGSGAIGGYGGASGGIGGGQYIYSSQTVATNHSGAALRLGNDATLGTTGIYRFVDGGALTMRVRLRKGDTVSIPAIAFVMGQRTATQMWQQDAYGLYFVPQPTNVWTSNGVVALNDRIAVSNVVWSVNTAGTNGATAPTWTDLIGSLVTNGSAVYRNLGPHTSNNYVLAIGSTNASQVVMTNTGKAGPVVGSRQEIVLKLRIDGTTNTPYTVYGTAENSAGESSEVSLTTTNNDNRQPQIWSRPDNLGTRTNTAVDLLIRYFSVDGTLNPL
jgi:hypothetical protein